MRKLKLLEKKEKSLKISGGLVICEGMKDRPKLRTEIYKGDN